MLQSQTPVSNNGRSVFLEEARAQASLGDGVPNFLRLIDALWSHTLFYFLELRRFLFSAERFSGAVLGPIPARAATSPLVFSEPIGDVAKWPACQS